MKKGYCILSVESCCAEIKTSESDDCDGAKEGDYNYYVQNDVLACYTVRVSKYNQPIGSRISP